MGACTGMNHPAAAAGQRGSRRKAQQAPVHSQGMPRSGVHTFSFILSYVHNDMRPKKKTRSVAVGLRGARRGCGGRRRGGAAGAALRRQPRPGGAPCLAARRAAACWLQHGWAPFTHAADLVARSARSWTPAPRPLRRHQAHMRTTTCPAPLQQGLLAMTPCRPSAWLCRISDEPMRHMRGGLPQPPLQGLVYSQREAGELAPVCRERDAARRRRPCPRP